MDILTASLYLQQTPRTFLLPSGHIALSFMCQVTFFTSSGCQYFCMQLEFLSELGGIQQEPDLEALSNQ